MESHYFVFSIYCYRFIYISIMKLCHKNDIPGCSFFDQIVARLLHNIYQSDTIRHKVYGCNLQVLWCYRNLLPHTCFGGYSFRETVPPPHRAILLVFFGSALLTLLSCLLC